MFALPKCWRFAPLWAAFVLSCESSNDQLPAGVVRLVPSLEDPVVDLAISSDGSKLAAVTNPVADSEDSSGLLAVWDLRSKQRLKERPFPIGVARVLFLPGGALVVGLIDGTLERLDAVSLETTAHRGSPQGAVTSLATEVDEKVLLTGYLSGAIERLSTDHLTLLNEYPPVTRAPVVAILPATDPRTFYYLNWDGHWGAHGDQDIRERTGRTSGFLGPVIHDAVLLPSEGKLATAGPEESLAILDLKTGEVQDRWQSSGEIIRLAHGASGELWSISRQSTVQRWDLREGKRIKLWKLDGYLQSLAVTPDGTIWCVGDDRGNVLVGPALGTAYREE